MDMDYVGQRFSEVEVDWRTAADAVASALTVWEPSCKNMLISVTCEDGLVDSIAVALVVAGLALETGFKAFHAT